MKRMTLTLVSLLPALFFGAGLLVAWDHDTNKVSDPSGKISTPPIAQDAAPLWASVPETISPEWGAFFSKKGKGRDTPMPKITRTRMFRLCTATSRRVFRQP